MRAGSLLNMAIDRERPEQYQLRLVVVAAHDGRREAARFGVGDSSFVTQILDHQKVSGGERRMYKSRKKRFGQFPDAKR